MKTVSIDKSWYKVLENEFNKDYFSLLRNNIRDAYKTHQIYPHPNNIFNAFDSTPLNKVKVVIIGQDPYHGPNQAHGLSFSVKRGVKIPPSLVNIFKELSDDLALAPPTSGNLEKWANQGVLLLNSVLTVEGGKANSHKTWGWEIFTRAVIDIISRKLDNIVFILWGRQAQQKEELIDMDRHLILKSVHPSPLSAYNGFYGCKHFSKTNHYLRENGKSEIDWSLT